MRNLISSLAFVAAAAFAALPSSAATLDIPGASLDYSTSVLGDVGDLLMFDAIGVVDDGGSLIDVLVDLTLTFEVADPSGTADAAIDILAGADLYLSGILSGISFEEDLLRLVFSGLTGSAAATFGSALQLEIFFLDPLGDNPLAALVDGSSYDVVAFGSDMAPIPLPASLPLLGGALGLLALRKRRKARI